jgi:riboflavin biosynthesis pyrimidine reductase
VRRLLPPPATAHELTDDDLVTAYAVTDDRSVRANFVSSVDGAVTVDGRSGGLGNAADRRLFALLRDLCDVILVGAGTVRTEQYGSTPSTPKRRARRAELGLSPVPRLAVVSARLALDPDSELFANDPPTIVITHADAPADQRKALEAVADVVVAGSGQIDITAALDALAEHGLGKVLCEGGPTLLGSVLEAGQLDELCLTLSPVVAGGPAGRIVMLPDPQQIALSVRHILEEDGALFLRYGVTVKQGATRQAERTA